MQRAQWHNMITHVWNTSQVQKHDEMQSSKCPLHKRWLHAIQRIMCLTSSQRSIFSTLRPRQNGRNFANNIFNRIFVNENVRISVEFSLKFIPKGPINNIAALVQIIAWCCLPCDKLLSEPVMVSLLTHICVTRLQRLNQTWKHYFICITLPGEV